MENKKLIKEYVKLCFVASQKANFMSMRAKALRDHSAAIDGLPNEEKAVLNAYFNEIFDNTGNIQIITGKTAAEIEAAYPAQTAAIKKAHAEFRVIERVDAFVTDSLDSKGQGKGKIFAAVKAEIIDKGLSIGDASVNWDAINATFKPVQERYIASDRLKLESEIAAITENPDSLAFKTATAALATLHAAPIYSVAEIEDLTKLYLISKDSLSRYEKLLADASTHSVTAPAKTSKLMEELKKYVEMLEAKGLTLDKAKQLETDKFRAKSAAYADVSKAFNEVGTIQNFHLLIGRIMGKEAGYYQANANQALQALEIETSKRIIASLETEKSKLGRLVDDFILIGKVTGSIMVDGSEAPEIISARNSYSDLMYKTAPIADAKLGELRTVLGRTTSEITSHASGGTTAIVTRPVNADVLKLVEDLQHDNFLYSKINGEIAATTADPKELVGARDAYAYLRKATPFKRSKTKSEKSAELEAYVDANFRVQSKKDDILDESRTLRPFAKGKGVKVVAGILAVVALAGAVGGVVADMMNADNIFTSKPAETQNAYADFTAALQEASIDGLTPDELATLRTTFYVEGEGLSEEQRTINFMLDNLGNGEAHTQDQIKTPADITYLSFIQAYADAAQDGLTADELETLKATYYATGDGLSAEQQTINSIIDGLSDGDAPVIENGVYNEFMESYAELSKDGLTAEEIAELQEIIDETDDAEAKTAMQNILNSSVDSAYESFMTLYGSSIADDILTSDEIAGLQSVVDDTTDATAKAALTAIMEEITEVNTESMYDQFMSAVATASADGISEAEVDSLRANYYKEAGEGETLSAEQTAINTVISSLGNQEAHTPDQIKTADDAAITAFTTALNNALPDGIDATEEAALESMIASSGASDTAKAMMTTLLGATLDGDQTITVTIEKMPESLKAFVEADTIEEKTALYNAEKDDAVKAVMEEMLEILNNQETHGPSDLITEADKDKIAGYDYMNQEFSEDLNDFIAEWNELLADNGGSLDFTDADTLTAINNLKGKYSANDKIDEYGVSSTEMIQRIIDNQRALQAASGAESTSDAFVSDFGGYVADGELSAEDVKALKDAYYTEGKNLTTEQKALNDMIDVLEDTVELKGDVADMQQSIDTLESANDALEKENADLEKENAKLQSDLKTYETNYNKLQDSYNKLEAQNKTLQEKYDALVASGNASAEELAAVQAQLQTVQAQLTTAQNTLTTAQNNLAALYEALGYDYTAGMSMSDMFSDIFFDLGVDYEEDTSENNKDNPTFGN